MNVARRGCPPVTGNASGLSAHGRRPPNSSPKPLSNNDIRSLLSALRPLRPGRRRHRRPGPAGARVRAHPGRGRRARRRPRSRRCGRDLFAGLTGDGLPMHVELVDLTQKAEVDAAFARVTRGARQPPPSSSTTPASDRRRPTPALETGPFEDYPESAWDAMIDSHLKSALFVSQAFIARSAPPSATPPAASSTSRPPTASCRPISRCTTTAAATARPYFKPVGYSVAKSGVLNFTRWLAEYCAPFGIRVNTLVPGGVREAGARAGVRRRVREAHAARPHGRRRTTTTARCCFWRRARRRT